MSKKAWQWDVKRSDEEIRKILRDASDPVFVSYAAMLLSRNNVPKEVFGYLDKKDFCMQWPAIKRHMRKDKWAQDRVVFWQEIYRFLKEEFKTKGVVFRRPAAAAVDPQSLRARIGNQIREIRRARKMSQAAVAQGAGMTQQFLSCIEKGTHNVSLDTLERIQISLKTNLLFGSKLPHE